MHLIKISPVVSEEKSFKTVACQQKIDLWQRSLNDLDLEYT